MSSHRRAAAPATRRRQRQGPRTPRLRLAVGGAAVLAALGGGTAFACMGGSSHPVSQPVARPIAQTSEQPSPAALAATPTVTPTTAQPHRSASATAHPTPRPARATTAHTSPSAAPHAPATSGATSGAPAAPVGAPEVQQVLALINQARSAQGLPAYTILDGLNRSAAGHNQVMAGGCGLSHQCPGESPFGDREQAQGVHWTSAGENIGEGGPTGSSDSSIASMAVGLTQSMLDEKPPNDGHRQNILSSSFTHIGIAVYRDASGTVWLTQDFSN
ncbi:uncharacterized protein YkwD [Streptacidiphilus sp. MAP12-16]|uniref:CAP domain-containing protein n=1 Tax=Streptacidiphilus sp. MAP12-16 TaxID=3156300 RepID=UPI0035151523